MRAGKPSSTALLIAQSTATASQRDGWDGLIDARAASFCETFVIGTGMLAPARRWFYRRGLFQSIFRSMERATLPGIQLHYALRKKKIEEIVRSGIGAGFRNIQIAGAGFDTLGLRLAADYPKIRVLEVDHPQTQAVKRRCLERLDRLPSNLTFKAFDLNAGSDSGAARPRLLHPELDTIVVAEGLLMYLPEVIVRRFFGDLRAQLDARLKVIFTIMAPDSAGRIRFHNSSRLVDRWLDFKGEPFTWGLSPAGLRTWLADSGFQLTDLFDHGDFRRLYLAGGPLASEPLAEGELLAVADAVGR